MKINGISGANTQIGQMGINQAQQKNGNFFDDMLGGSRNAGTTGSADMGVLISLSATKEQIAGMRKVRTDLEGKLRNAETDEARESLQKKIDSLTEDIYVKVKETQDTISDYQKTEQDKTDMTQDKKEDEKGDETNVVSEEEISITSSHYPQMSSYNTQTTFPIILTDK